MAYAAFTQNSAMWFFPAGLCGGMVMFIWALEHNYRKSENNHCFALPSDAPSLHSLYSCYLSLAS